jgi:hypothetical protein
MGPSILAVCLLLLCFHAPAEAEGGPENETAIRNIIASIRDNPKDAAIWRNGARQLHPWAYKSSDIPGFIKRERAFLEISVWRCEQDFVSFADGGLSQRTQLYVLAEGR